MPLEYKIGKIIGPGWKLNMVNVSTSSIALILFPVFHHPLIKVNLFFCCSFPVNWHSSLGNSLFDFNFGYGLSFGFLIHGEFEIWLCL